MKNLNAERNAIHYTEKELVIAGVDPAEPMLSQAGNPVTPQMPVGKRAQKYRLLTCAAQ